MEGSVMVAFPAPRNQMAPMSTTTSFHKKMGLGMRSARILKRKPVNYTEVQRVLVGMEEGEDDWELNRFRKRRSKEQNLKVSWMAKC
jgi:hypothetical protein